MYTPVEWEAPQISRFRDIEIGRPRTELRNGRVAVVYRLAGHPTGHWWNTLRASTASLSAITCDDSARTPCVTAELSGGDWDFGLIDIRIRAAVEEANHSEQRRREEEASRSGDPEAARQREVARIEEVERTVCRQIEARYGPSAAHEHPVDLGPPDAD